MSCKIAITQPYTFPYFGYFQLVEAADIFVFYDDVNFIKRGWINRNKLLIDGKESLFSIPLIKASQNKLICETRIFHENGQWQLRLLKTIEQAYKNAPFFSEVYPLIENILGKKQEYISTLAIDSIVEIAGYLDLKTTFKTSSESFAETKNNERADRLIEICKLNNCESYINLPGGKVLYEKEYFKEKGIDLSFIESKAFAYKQYSGESFVGLSIIDVLMFNSIQEILKHITNYNLT